MRAFAVFPLAGLAVLSLAGCHLIDQSDFRPKRPAAAPPPPVPNPETRTALVTIDYATPSPDYKAALAQAVGAVETRRPGSVYDVVGVVAGASDVSTAELHAADVMTAIEADGVISARVQLGLYVEPGLKTQQVRVYLR